MAQHRLLVVGFDAMDFSLIEGWIAEGHLPILGNALERSFVVSVENPMGFEAGSVWPTFATGCRPAAHGQFDGFQKFDPERYQKRALRRNEVAVDAFWSRVGRTDRRVAVIDVPYAFLDRTVNGVQVVDWLPHVRQPEGLVTRPAGLARDLAVGYGTNPFDPRYDCPTNLVKVDTPAAVADFVSRLGTRTRWKAAYSAKLLRQEPWDTFVTVFLDAHDVGHMCWHIHDASHERHDPALAAEAGDPVRDVYVALDRALGEVLRAADPDSTVFLYFSHGMGSERTLTGFLDTILGRLHEAYYPGAAAAALQAIPDDADLLRRAYRSLVPAPWRLSLRRRLSGESRSSLARTARPGHGAKMPPGRGPKYRMARRFFEMNANQATGGIRINLRGRESRGLVSPGPEYAALCQRLIRDLGALVNADSGEPVVVDAYETTDFHPGAMRPGFPDILLEWNKAAPIERVRSPLIGTLEIPFRRARTGDHINKRGTVLVMGPTIRPGRRDEPVKAWDLAPTIAALVGAPTDAYEGQAIAELADTETNAPGS